MSLTPARAWEESQSTPLTTPHDLVPIHRCHCYPCLAPTRLRLRCSAPLIGYTAQQLLLRTTDGTDTRPCALRAARPTFEPALCNLFFCLAKWMDMHNSRAVPASAIQLLMAFASMLPGVRTGPPGYSCIMHSISQCDHAGVHSVPYTLGSGIQTHVNPVLTLAQTNTPIVELWVGGCGGLRGMIGARPLQCGSPDGGCGCGGDGGVECECGSQQRTTRLLVCDG